MKVKIIINTANGSANKVTPYLKTYLLGVNRKGLKYECLNNDNQIIIEAEGTVKKILRIQRNCSKFDIVMQKGMKNKKIRRLAGFKSTEEQEAEIDSILANHTKVEIIKEATAAELDSYGRSFWQKLKDKFKTANL